MKALLRSSLAVLAALVMLTASAHAFMPTGPEIDPSMGPGALALLAGAIVVIRGRRRK